MGRMVSKAARWGFQNRGRSGGFILLAVRLETRRNMWMGALVLTAVMLWDAMGQAGAP